jgi:hypothetical protein
MRIPLNDDFHFWTASEFLCRDFTIEKEEDVTGGGLLPRRAKAIIGGVSKIGKSLLCLEWALSLISGKPFLIQFPIPKSFRVAMLQGEISEKSMQERILKTTANDPQLERSLTNLFLLNNKTLKLDSPRDLKLLSEELEKINPDVFILDPLYKFHRGDENKTTDMVRFFDAFDTLLDRHNMSGILVHHFGKPTETKRDGAQQLRGSSTIFDVGDSYLILNRISAREGKSYFKISFELRNDEDPAPLYIHRNPETLRHEVLDEETEEKLTITQIVKTVRAMGGSARKGDLIRRLETDTGLSGRSVRDIVDRAITVGRVYERPLLIESHSKGRPTTEIYIL